jgi:hypothetical protein
MDVEWGDHNYFVTALYNDSEECGESEPSNTVDVTLVNHPPPAVFLIQPGDLTTIVVTGGPDGNIEDNFPFIWGEVYDEDNDPVLYVVSVIAVSCTAPASSVTETTYNTGSLSSS